MNDIIYGWCGRSVTMDGGGNFEKKWIIEGIAAVYEALYLATYTEFQWGFKGIPPLYFIWVSPLPLEN